MYRLTVYAAIPALLLFLTTTVNALKAQPGPIQLQSETQPVTLGITHIFHSLVLKEERKLNVYLPPNYLTETSAAFPVLFLLDGGSDEHFIHVSGIMQFLAMTGQASSAIVVGIANVDRKRDFTFSSGEDAQEAAGKTSGGSAAFVRFIGEEVIPFINRQYRTDGQRTLIAGSEGGLLAGEVLLKQAGWFGDYLIVAPDLQWNNRSILQDFENLKGHLDTPDTRVTIACGGRSAKERMADAKELYRVLRSQKSGPLMTFMPLRDENEGSAMHNAVYRYLTAPRSAGR